jgi:CheY-like chemotaxis protein
VVDDSAVMRLMLERQLKVFGFDVKCAAAGPEALKALFSDWTPDLFLFDWYMPEVGGMDLVLAVRRQARFQSAKILMVTAETDMAQMQTALKGGADGCLAKPVTADSLREKLFQLKIAKDWLPRGPLP